jgi:hypothetical protein
MVKLTNGDTLVVRCAFQHKGKAYSGGKAYAAIYKLTNGNVDETGINGTITGLNVPNNDVDWEDYYVDVPIPMHSIGTGVGQVNPGAIYGVTAKITNIPGTSLYCDGPIGDIELVGEVGEATFQNLTVTYTKG